MSRIRTWLSEVKIRLNDYRDVAFLPISSVVYAAIILFAFRSLSASGAAQEIYYLTLLQQASAIVVVYLFYGVNFDPDVEKRHYSVVPLVVLIIIISFLNVYLAIFFGMVARVGFSKFTRYSEKSSFMILVVIVGYFGHLFLNKSHVTLDIVVAALLISFAIQIAFGHQLVELANISRLRVRNFTWAIIRSSLDFSILVPPIIINYLYFKFGSPEDFIELQRIFFTLAGSSVFVALVERLVFDRTSSGSHATISVSEILLLGAVLSIICSIIGLFVGLSLSNFPFLIYSAFYGIFFGTVLAKVRSNISAMQAMLIGAIQLACFCSLVGVMAALNSVSLELLLILNCAFSVFQVAPVLFFLKNRDKAT